MDIKTLNRKTIFAAVTCVLVLASISAGVYLVQETQILKPRADTAKTTPFYGKEISFIKLFGQTKFSDTSRNIVTNNKTYHAPGVLVDTSSNPNKVYVVDSGNNRILGFNGIGYCRKSSNTTCTVDSDCGEGDTCKADGNKGADIVFGQTNFEETSCNRDNNLGITKKPAADTLCFLDFPIPPNIAEMWGRSNFDVDAEGNLYIVDTANNRVLKYNQPFSSDKSGGKGDTIADFVLGQDDFSSNGINKGDIVYYRTTLTVPVPAPSATSLYLSRGFEGPTATGVSVDKNNNVWVADTQNYRVLRFPKDSKTADLVIGQENFNNRIRNSRCYDDPDKNPDSFNHDFVPLNRFCYPSVAKVNPDTGELYVLQEYAKPFRARITVFKPPFTNGMSAYKIIVPRQDNTVSGYDKWTAGSGPYAFQSSGFVFNTYKEGEYAEGTLWVNEHETLRTILIDDDGNIIKVIGAPDKYHKGGDLVYPGGCGDIYEGFHLWWPGGQMSFDKDHNIYLADERFNRISRYQLPYNTRAVGTKTCLPEPNGGLLPGVDFNVRGNNNLGESVGTGVWEGVSQSQLFVQDEGGKIKVWNDYLNKPQFNISPDLIISGGLGGRRFLSNGIDDSSRLWVFNEWGVLKIYQLPFGGNDIPLAGPLKLYWSDDQGEVSYGGGGGIAFDKLNKKLYVVDQSHHRILRVSNYNDFNDKLLVDLVIGQPDKNTVGCNHNQKESDKNLHPSADSLCLPVFIKFDNLGNLYVVEDTYEGHGNRRVTVFLAEDLKNTQGLFPTLQAKKVFNAPDFTTRGSSSYDISGRPGTPVTLAFDSQNKLVIANDGYYGDLSVRQNRQLWLYNNPLTKQTPDAYIEIPMGAPGEIVFDSQDNLIIQDHTWSRVWLINLNRDPSWTVFLETIPTPSPTPTPTRTPTSTPVPFPTTEPTTTLAPTATPTPTPPATVPTCIAAHPSAATTTATSGTFRVYATGVQNATDVKFPTWSAENGQDDLIWYPGTNAGGGTWYANIDLAKHPGLGWIRVHIYMFNSNYTNQLCLDHTADFQRILPSTTPCSETGDINGDGLTDMTDYDFWSDSFRDKTPDGDCNKDGVTDLLDYYLWWKKFNNLVYR